MAGDGDWDGDGERQQVNVMWLFFPLHHSNLYRCFRYCLTHSPVPIIVVQPERKVRKAMEKRKADPKRGKHFDA